MSMKARQDTWLVPVQLLDGGTTLRDVLDKHIHDPKLPLQSSFFVADIGVVVKQHVLWKAKMEQIRPFYSLKSNSSPVLLEVLAALGTGFACSNKRELDLVKSFGVPSRDIILSGTCKQLSHIKHAAKHSVTLLVCDSEAEMRKIARCHSKAKVLLLVASESGPGPEETLLRFGSGLKDCRRLLECAVDLGLQVTGVKFNIPSCCEDARTFSRAVSDARCVFDMAEELGFSMTLLDIGGGFNGGETQLDKVKLMLRPMLDVYFPPSSRVSIIAEPGAFYASSAFTLAVKIMAKRILARDMSEQPLSELSANDEPEFLYHMSEGVYGSFSSILLREDSIPVPSVHKEFYGEEPLFSSSLWGPSEDDLDRVLERCQLPELSVGDWLIFTCAGERSLTAMVTNGEEQQPPVYYTITEHDWMVMNKLGLFLENRMKNWSLVPCFLKSSRSESVSAPA